MDKFSERLKTAMIYANMTQKDLVTATGIDKRKISQYVNDVCSPVKLEGFIPIAKALNVNPAWLAGFEVPMENFVITDKEIQLLKKIKMLNESGRAKLDEYLNDLMGNPRNIMQEPGNDSLKSA